MTEVELPTGDTVAIELELDPDVRARATDDPLAPDDEIDLLRYLVYLGAAYLEAERVADYAEIHRRFGAVGGKAAVLRFHFAEAARAYAAEQRAAAANDRYAGTYGLILERIEQEIAVRERRIANLEEALRR